MQKEEYLIKNACYSVTKYYLCKQNNKRSLLGRKQRSQVARSFPNRYQFSCINKVTSLFSISCILRIILHCKRAAFATSNRNYRFPSELSLQNQGVLFKKQNRKGRSPERLRPFIFSMCFDYPKRCNSPTTNKSP